jgi:nicotinamidase-related amidase
MRSSLLCLVGLLAFLSTLPAAESDTGWKVPLRTRFEAFKGSDQWQEATFPTTLDPKKTAVIICDMWDDHWCISAAKRCDVLARKTEPLLVALRKKGVTIFHCPSDTMAFYADTPQRKATQKVTLVKPPANRPLADPPLPIDDSDGGCDDDKPSKSYRAWKRQHAAITIAENDLISDNGVEVYSHLKARGIDTLLILGVHTNMCICNRSFAIKQMTRWGIKCILVRDLTDAMYNPKKRPFVSHDKGTGLVIEHIEKHWCPTVLSEDLLK